MVVNLIDNGKPAATQLLATQEITFRSARTKEPPMSEILTQIDATNIKTL